MSFRPELGVWDYLGSRLVRAYMVLVALVIEYISLNISSCLINPIFNIFSPHVSTSYQALAMAQAKPMSSKSLLASPTLEDSDSSFEGIHRDDSLEKDKLELELEKVVFGDEVGFQRGLDAHGQSSHSIESGGEEEEGQLVEEEAGFEGVDDADVRTRALPQRPRSES